MMFRTTSHSCLRIIKTLAINPIPRKITVPILNCRYVSDKKGPWGTDDGLESGFRPIVEGPGEEPWIPEFENKLQLQQLGTCDLCSLYTSRHKHRVRAATQCAWLLLGHTP